MTRCGEHHPTVRFLVKECLLLLLLPCLQVPIFACLSKFDGSTINDDIRQGSASPVIQPDMPSCRAHATAAVLPAGAHLCLPVHF
jgi:hypothetical protein